MERITQLNHNIRVHDTRDSSSSRLSAADIWHKANELRGNGKFADSEKLISDFLYTKPLLTPDQNFNLLLAQAQSYSARNRTDLAEAKFREAITVKGPKFAEKAVAIRLIEQMYSDRKQFEKVIAVGREFSEKFKEAADTHPLEYANFLALYASALTKKKDDPAAKGLLYAALSLFDDSVEKRATPDAILAATALLDLLEAMGDRKELQRQLNLTLSSFDEQAGTDNKFVLSFARFSAYLLSKKYSKEELCLCNKGLKQTCMHKYQAELKKRIATCKARLSEKD